MHIRLLSTAPDALIGGKDESRPTKTHIFLRMRG
jgi:hypothetical protein